MQMRCEKENIIFKIIMKIIMKRKEFMYCETKLLCMDMINIVAKKGIIISYYVYLLCNAVGNTKFYIQLMQ